MLSSCSFVVNNTIISSEDNITKLSGRKKITNDLFVFSDFNIKSGRDDSTFIDSSKKFNHNFSSSSIIYDFEVSDII